MAANNFLPSATFQQLLHANKIFQEYTIVVGNEGITSEAKEPARKRRLLQQLKNAKRLRYAIGLAETAARNAATAEEARQIMMSHKSDICELVSLTEAVRCGYTLSEKAYHSYSECHAKEAKLDETSIKHGKKVISDHLRAMSKERTEMDNHARAEKKAAATKREFPSTALEVITQQQQVLASNQEKKSPEGFHVDRSAAAVLFGMYANSSIQNESDGKRNGSESDNLNASTGDDRKKSAKSLKMKRPPKHLLFQNLTTNEDSENGKKQAVDSNSFTTVDTPSGPGTKFPSGPFYYPPSLNPFLNPINPSGYKVKERKHSLQSNSKDTAMPKKKKQPFKCHGCKELSDDTVRCNLVRANGSKCTKQFCKNCLVHRHKVSDFKSLKNDKTWHCPACLGTCLCRICLKAREKKQKVTIKRHKCHDCKESSTEYVRCNYWQPTGNKCNKYFCKNCITSKYDSNPVVDEKEWHCPACLGTCKCKACTKVRDKKNRESLERRSGRGPNYGYYSLMNGDV
uniref:RING-type domain-containing protein n=1 Tax=Leptocylindrus danicus TaxID=163516 RepID=A0A7S2JSU6_9STRA|mmetsp:Transcript_11152/g.16897  ORF Transcript_11152/g.16897 Transcript_11152/m.16897 type:complete len:514 (+) Transcript_11152:38-1579(+)